jgi:hypothetical protein
MDTNPDFEKLVSDQLKKELQSKVTERRVWDWRAILQHVIGSGATYLLVLLFGWIFGIRLPLE